MTNQQRRQRGFSLIEVMIAGCILAVGMLACINMLLMGMMSNAHNKNDSGATMLSQMVIEQINTMPVNSGLSISVTDCNGKVWTVNTAAAVGPAGAGASIDNNPADVSYGKIDFTQAKTSVPPGYQMDYVMCSSGAAQGATYDVRWNIATISPKTNMVTVSARQTADPGQLVLSLPANLRTIQGK